MNLQATLFAAGGFNGALTWSSVEVTILEVVAIIIASGLYFLIFKFSHLSIFIYILCMLCYFVLFKQSTFVGKNQAEYWAMIGFVGFLALAYFIYKKYKKK